MSYPYLTETHSAEFHKSEENLVSIIETVLNGDDYEGGEVEHARAQADNASKMLARLLLMLYQTGNLSEEQLKFVIDPSSLGFNEGNHRWPSEKPLEPKFAPLPKTGKRGKM